ncbi:MAG: terminase family protein, partial [Verrucomicrobiota bacterium]
MTSAPVRPLRDSTLPAYLSPKDLLYPLQRKFVDDSSQYKIGVTTRQWGKSTTTSGEAVHDSLTDPGTKWVCMSAGERQSVEWLSKAKEWVAAYKLVIEDIAEDRGGIAEGLLRSSEIILNNGSKIIAIPANPSTARGYSANTILDEFAYHEDPDAIWAAMFPATTNALAGTFLQRWRAMLAGETSDSRRSMKLRVVSTFNGRNNKFYQLYEKAAENGYTVHTVTIHDAIADG